MSKEDAAGARLVEIAVWDRTVRWFHAINAVCVILLIALGLLILNASEFGVSNEGKVLLKTLHVYAGYVLALNLLWRIVWAFAGGRYSRWRSLLPCGRNYTKELRIYIRGLVNGKPPAYAGHNPLARLMVTFLLSLLLVQVLTGLVLAGTDLYKPPIGGLVAEWVTANDPRKLANLTPGSKEYVDAVAYDEMRAFRKPFVTVHLYSFYVLLIAVALHGGGVIATELIERQGLVSALITGRKILSRPPSDGEST